MRNEHLLPIDPRDPGFLLSRSLDETVSPEDLAQLDALFEGDSSLQEDLEAYRRLSAWGARLGEDEPKIDWNRFESGVMARLNAEDARGSRRWSLVFRLSPIVAAAAALLVFLYPRLWVESPSSSPSGASAPSLLVQVEKPAWFDKIQAARSTASSGLEGVDIPVRLVRVNLARTPAPVEEDEAPARRLLVGVSAATSSSPKESSGFF